jgi:hypothetical protein
MLRWANWRGSAPLPVVADNLCMAERLVRSTWWVLVMGFIGLAGIGAVYAGYWGVAELIVRRWETGLGAILIGLTLGISTLLACRHRSDLLYG